MPIHKNILGLRRERLAVAILGLVLLCFPLAVLLDVKNISHVNLEQQAHDLDLMVTSIRRFYSTDVVARVLANHEQQGKVIHNYQDVPGAIPLPATLSLELGRIITEKQSGIRYRFISDYPFRLRKKHVLDEFELGALNSLRMNSAKPIVKISSNWYSSEVRSISPVIMQDTCVECHNNHPDSMKKNWKVGDVRGLQEVTITQPLGAGLLSFKFSLAYFLFVALLGSLVIFVQRRQRTIITDINDKLKLANVDALQCNEALNGANRGLAESVETLRQLGDIGRNITANLDADTVFQLLYRYVDSLLEASSLCIYRMNADATALELAFGQADEDGVTGVRIPLDALDASDGPASPMLPMSPIARAARERQELLFEFDASNDQPFYVGKGILTAVFAPLIVADRVLGVMSILSERQQAYSESQRLIFRTLSAYGAIALANAEVLSSLNQANAQLLQQEKLASLGGMVAKIAHEVNTPLGTTLLALSGVEDAWGGLRAAMSEGRLSKDFFESSTREGLEYTALALRTASRAAELITLFKSIAVPSSIVKTVDIDVGAYLAEIISIVRKKLQETGSSFSIVVSEGLRVQVAPDILTEVLGKVLNNVIDHAFTQGRIGHLLLKAEMDHDGDVIIEVRDDGHGIAPDDLPKVFDPFFTTKSTMEGFIGLGLHVAYNHVTHGLNGRISIDSTQNQGTTVTIKLKPDGDV